MAGCEGTGHVSGGVSHTAAAWDCGQHNILTTLTTVDMILFVCVCAEPLEKGHLFSAKYVPFTPTDVDETYSLDEVIYRCVSPAARK